MLAQAPNIEGEDALLAGLEQPPLVREVLAEQQPPPGHCGRLEGDGLAEPCPVCVPSLCVPRCFFPPFPAFLLDLCRAVRFLSSFPSVFRIFLAPRGFYPVFRGLSRALSYLSSFPPVCRKFSRSLRFLFCLSERLSRAHTVDDGLSSLGLCRLVVGRHAQKEGVLLDQVRRRREEVRVALEETPRLVADLGDVVGDQHVLVLCIRRGQLAHVLAGEREELLALDAAELAVALIHV
mmetsp:Transcript_54451/g.133086  ORF Transcript_54451/g.133086 Transcript_54451/m.133086 type:complete len:236 (+) Transcript_54451:1762-2469(+)